MKFRLPLAFGVVVALCGIVTPPGLGQGRKPDNQQPPPDPTPGIFQQGPPMDIGFGRPAYSRVRPPTPMVEITPSLDQLKANVSESLTNNGHLQQELSLTAKPSYRSIAAYAGELRRRAFRLQRVLSLKPLERDEHPAADTRCLADDVRASGAMLNQAVAEFAANPVSEEVHQLDVRMLEKADLDALRGDQRIVFKVNYLKIHLGWAWVDTRDIFPKPTK